MSLLNKLRSEVCKMPVKPNANGLIELYTKDQMKSKFNVSSPNLGDSVMMLMTNPASVKKKTKINYVGWG
jgi:phage terminase large subunit